MFDQLERKPLVVVSQRRAVLTMWTVVGCAFTLGIMVGMALVRPKSPDWPIDILNFGFLACWIVLIGNAVARLLREKTPESH